VKIQSGAREDAATGKANNPVLLIQSGSISPLASIIPTGPLNDASLGGFSYLNVDNTENDDIALLLNRRSVIIIGESRAGSVDHPGEECRNIGCKKWNPCPQTLMTS